MFPLGHLGVGSTLVRPWSQGLSRRLILLGTLLPDLIDKPLYYGLVFITGRRGAELGLISGTRTLAHTALTALVLTLFAYFRKSKLLTAICLGLATHLILDGFSEWIELQSNQSFLQILLWPTLGWNFPVAGFDSLGQHLRFWHRPVILYSEIIGGCFLILNSFGSKRTRLSGVKPNR